MTKSVSPIVALFNRLRQRNHKTKGAFGKPKPRPEYSEPYSHPRFKQGESPIATPSES